MRKRKSSFQKLHPDYPIQLRFNYAGKVTDLVGQVIVKKDGVVENSFLYEIANPNPDQSNIK
jgi:hypothetical protein